MRAKKSILKKLRQTTLAELAVLEMTNDPKTKADSDRDRPVMVTTKEAYVWAVLMAHVAEKRPDIRPKDFVRATTREPQIRKRIKLFYEGFPLQEYEEGEMRPNAEVRADVLESVIDTLQLDIEPNRLVNSAQNAYFSLTRKGLIEDPVEIVVGGVLLAAMGLLPVSFTQKTKEGRAISKKLKALYWSYDKSEVRGVTTTKVEFRLLRMIRAFKAGMIGGFKGAMKDDDDEAGTLARAAPQEKSSRRRAINGYPNPSYGQSSSKE